MKFNKSIAIEIISGMFILLFVYTAVSKFYTMEKFKFALSESALISNYSNIIAWAIPVVELIITLLLFFPKTRKWGLYSSLALMLLFTGYLGYMIYFTPNLPCNCGGVISLMTWKQHLIFNSVFIALGIIGIWLNNKTSHSDPSKNEKNIAYS